jgi:hypothetical protein
VATNGLKPSNFKEWLWSAKVLTTIVWILYPLSYIIIIFVLTYYDYFVLTSEKIDLPPFIRPVPFYIYEVILSNIPIEYSISIPPIPLLTILFLFAVVPAALSSEKFFRKRGEVNCVFEYQYIKKILYVTLAVLIIAIISLYSMQSYYLQGLIIKGERFPEPERAVNHLLSEIVFALPAVPILILLKLLLQHARKQFRFYYAKSCFKIMNEKKSEADKAEYFRLGLGWYNKFVKRITSNVFDIETIYSRIISNSQLSNNILIDTLSDTFKDKDELKPMRHMLTLLSYWKEGPALVKESLRTKIRESRDLLIPIVTVVIAIITTFFLPQPAT